MSTNARRIALQGIGFGAVSIASQGFLPLNQVAPPSPPPFVGGTGGGQVSLSEWLRRYGKATPDDHAAIGDPIDQAATERDAMRRRKRRRVQTVLFLRKNS
jgi:hypothetical protein